MSNIRQHDHLCRIRSRAFIFKILFVASLTLIISYIVYFFGGTKTALPHLMYVPIILAALYFGIAGALCAALIGGIALGPFMPENVALGLMQQPAGWIVRWVFFSLIGVLIAILFKGILSYAQEEKERSTTNLTTGLPNANKLSMDLEHLMAAETEVSLLGFRLVNIDEINQYASYDIGVKALLKTIETLTRMVSRPVYSIYANELAVIVPGEDLQQARQIALLFLDEMKTPLSLDGFNIALIIKCGLVQFPRQTQSPGDMIKKMSIALTHETKESELQVYDIAIAEERKARFDMAVALLNALKNQEFYLVYQPKIDLRSGRVVGVEALLRWEHAGALIGPATFICLAEELGIIGEITKWVVRNSVAQAVCWAHAGVHMPIALNLSPKDLKDQSVVRYLIECIEESTLDPRLIEVELTERGLFENEQTLLQLLKMLRDLGVKVALDDVGTGYNSLVDLVVIPIDHIKIDKTFIDHIASENYRVLVKSIIDFAHNTGGEVIAEGVETKEQLGILENMGCSFVQGYYFSKPLPLNELEAYLSASHGGQTDAAAPNPRVYH